MLVSDLRPGQLLVYVSYRYNNNHEKTKVSILSLVIRVDHQSFYNDNFIDNVYVEFLTPCRYHGAFKGITRIWNSNFSLKDDISEYGYDLIRR